MAASCIVCSTVKEPWRKHASLQVLHHCHNSKNAKNVCKQQSNCDGYLFLKPWGMDCKFNPDDGETVSNPKAVLQRFENLYLSQELSDIVIVVGLKVFHAHKLILSCASDVLKVMLNNPRWLEAHKGKVILKEEPECIAVFDNFLKYMYTGSIHLNHRTVLPILLLADKYNLSDLSNLCIKYMCSHMVSTSTSNQAVSWLQYGQVCGHDNLVKTCHDFILLNFEKVMQTRDFLCMHKNTLVTFLKNSELVVEDEFVLYQGVIHWLCHQMYSGISRDTLPDVALEVFSNIRFPMMPPTFLKAVDVDLIPECSRFVKQKILLATEFHALRDKERNDLACTSYKMEDLIPRNYTSDTWSTALAIENFSKLQPFSVRPIIFSSPVSGSAADENALWEWSADLYPRGILFQRFIMIGLQRNLDIDETVYNTVRLSVSSTSGGSKTVNIAILAIGCQDGTDYVQSAQCKRFVFDEDHKVCHFNDVVPFDELTKEDSPYLLDKEGNTFKIIIIIKPV